MATAASRTSGSDSRRGPGDYAGGRTRTVNGPTSVLDQPVNAEGWKTMSDRATFGSAGKTSAASVRCNPSRAR